MDDIDTYFDSIDEIVCPHCGEESPFESADYGLYTEEAYKTKCDDCKKEYEIYGSMSWSWSTEQL